MKSAEDIRQALDSGDFEGEKSILETDGRDVLEEAFLESPHPFRQGLDASVGLGSKIGTTSYYHVVLADKEEDGPRGEYFVTEWTPIRDADPRALGELGFETDITGEEYLVVSFYAGSWHAELMEPEADDPYETQEELVDAIVRGMAMAAQSHNTRPIEVEGYLVGDEIPDELVDEYERIKDGKQARRHP